MNIAVVSRLLALLCLCAVAIPAKSQWDTIPADDLAQTSCKTYPGANAEILFQRITIDVLDGRNCAIIYKRIKIYSREGAEQAGVLNIEHPQSAWARVWGQAARVTKPDGQTAEFGEKDFNKSTMIKVEGVKMMRQSLAVPNLAAGDILDIAWVQEIGSRVSSYHMWAFQTSIPMREFIFDVEKSCEDYDLRAFNVGRAEIKRISTNQQRLEAHDIPPMEEESCTPPKQDVRGWIMLLYTSYFARWYSDADIWENISTYSGEDYRLATRFDREMKAKANKIIEGATTNEEKLKRLYSFCQTNIENIDYSDSPKLQAIKKKIDEGDHEPTAAKTLSCGGGYSRHVNTVFAALAQAVGFEVRLFLSANRNLSLDVKNSRGWIFMRDHLVAVRVDDQWRIFSPGSYYAPYGLLSASNELTPGLICDEKKPIFYETQAAPASKSIETRIGRFTLDEEGTLEGEVEIQMGGHLGEFQKGDWNEKQATEIDTLYREQIASRLPSAEITDLKWENLRTPEAPLIARYKIKVSGYAELTGSRIIFSPSVFKHGAPAFFTQETRKNPIMFKSAWGEHDEISITLPEGYALDGASSPSNLANPETDVVGVRYKLAYNGKQRALIYKRDFAVGGNSCISLPVDAYPALKKFFDALHQQDEHKIVLKPKAPAAATTTP